MSAPRSTPASPAQQPPEPPHRTPWWWPMVTSAFGLAVIGYEVAFDKLDRPYIITAGLALALGGKVVDKWLS